LVKGTIITMSNIINLALKTKPNRNHAKQWLSLHIKSLPNMNNNIGKNMFYGWRFIRGIDSVVYFANCIEPGIDEIEFNEFINR